MLLFRRFYQPAPSSLAASSDVTTIVASDCDGGKAESDKVAAIVEAAKQDTLVLAKQFGSAVAALPDNVSMAQLQGYLLLHKSSPCVPHILPIKFTLALLKFVCRPQGQRGAVRYGEAHYGAGDAEAAL
eukprot:SAG11_NODE_108_length_16386_cov_20.828329_9_plen_129_part_00